MSFTTHLCLTFIPCVAAVAFCWKMMSFTSLHLFEVGVVGSSHAISAICYAAKVCHVESTLPVLLILQSAHMQPLICSLGTYAAFSKAARYAFCALVLGVAYQGSDCLHALHAESLWLKGCCLHRQYRAGAGHAQSGDSWASQAQQRGPCHDWSAAQPVWAQASPD